MLSVNYKIAVFFTVLGALLIVGVVPSSPSDEEQIPHNTKTILFRTGKFKKIAGELWAPATEGKHPLVIMVLGDGPGYRSYFSSLKRCFLRAGYASFMWDKPGYGASSGKFSRDGRLSERADILLAAMEKMKKRDDIDTERIGWWGISQASYVMPIALTRIDDVAFMIVAGGALEDGIEQTAYFVEQQIVCAGIPEEEARRAGILFAGVCKAQTYDEYVKNGQPLLDGFPIVKDLDVMAGILPEENWNPRDPNGEAFFDPTGIVEKTTIPVLALWGQKDRNCDPFGGAEAYREALARAGNSNYVVEIFPGADHNIILCESGCEKERNKRSREGWSNYAPAYIDLMETWLKELLAK
jgi:pimeloyl-ACP methyl ester carboxylesterase